MQKQLQILNDKLIQANEEKVSQMKQCQEQVEAYKQKLEQVQ